MGQLLSEELRRLRIIRGCTLRDVEQRTGISNAYLSQLENGKAENPSPRVLHKLAEFYDLTYAYLMEMAGYLKPPGRGQEAGDAVNKAGAALMSANLNPQEDEMIANFIEVVLRGREGGRR